MARFRVVPQGAAADNRLVVTFERLNVDDVLEAYDAVEGMCPGPLDDVSFAFASVRLLVEEVRRLRNRVMRSVGGPQSRLREG